MQLNLYVNTISNHLKERFGERVRKLTVDGSFSCPNRDGSIGRGGCTFCNMDSFVKPEQHLLPVADQLALRKQELKHSNIKYLAYFQAYSSTYGEIQHLKKMYQQALQEPDIVGICVGTRPDCLSDEVLALLADYQEQGKEVWLELGLQTAHDHTLRRINRGHDFTCYQQAVAKAKSYNINICCHLILGLPGEGTAEYRKTLAQVLETGVQGLKLHPLHIVEGSAMARTWRAGRLRIMAEEEYTQAAVDIIQHTPKDIIYHRVTAKGRPPVLLAPDWCGDRWSSMVAISKKLAGTGSQGSKC
ncbi:TIGR01212 family radical SAM protein [Teredinibacter haidensis]|uniref:TIGR01212 family radical SAM protein n=1 Tax=Teredinibacter haidensis TaxID=2731755 RepID=UPI00094908A8|nr:TIGR01212 family radical SAM protein [Teredinibacter haidensis]